MFLLINLSDLANIKKHKSDISITDTRLKILVICKLNLSWYSFAITITEVMDAGPAKIGVANGKTETLFPVFFMIFSFLSCLLLKSISIEIKSNITPPAILKDSKDIFK